ncbi:MAG: LuxR C-terminal-related transcriptional regulator [Candidatus Brocadiaceae bacterium]|nr:LuxR C-terminal-related transcriptional regulator [Candidatus Brocadiaceae bacterium]
MPLKSEFLKKDEKQSKQYCLPMIQKYITDDSVADFAIGEQSFLIIPENLLYEHDAFPKDKIVGKLKTNQKIYYIIKYSEKNGQREKVVNNLVEMLTRRELQIVMLVAEGKVNKQIANQLKISEWTVSTHLRRIFAKLGVDSRASMVYRCSELLSWYSKQFYHRNTM